MGKSVWQSQQLALPQLSFEYVRHQADKLDADFRYQSRQMYWLVILAVFSFAVNLWHSPETITPMTQVQRWGSAFLVVGVVYLLMQGRRRGRLLASGEEGAVRSLDAYREELKRRRDLYRDAWRWSLWPIAPSVLVLFVGGLVYDPRPDKLVHYGIMALVVLVLTLLSVWYYRRKGNVFERELQALATMEKS